MDDSSELPRSLFVVEFLKKDQYLSILQLEAPNLDCPKEHKVRFNLTKEKLLSPIPWTFSPPTSSTGEDLYLFPSGTGDNPLKFNLRTKSFQKIPCLLPFTTGHAYAVNHGGRIYRMEFVVPYFGCYDPENNSWKALKPFPYDKGFKPRVQATAALDDTILFYMPCNGFRVYDIGRNEWYLVDVGDPRCFTIVGEAVVLENTIYAVTSLGVLLALSIEKEVRDGDVVFKCSLLSQVNMPCMAVIIAQEENGPIVSPQVRVKTNHLVHLGGVDFCLVRTCEPLLSKGHKCIHVTYMRLTLGKVIVKSDHLFKTLYEEQSEVALCFSLSKWKTAALEEGKQFHFELDPFTAEDHFSIRVRDYWSPKVTVTQLEEGFKTYGPIKRDEIKVKNKMGELLDFGEFQRLTSKQHAIKVSQSLFAVVFYFNEPHLRILQLDTPGHCVREPVKNTNVDGLKEHMVRFNEAKGRWSVSPPISSTGDLCLFPDWCDVKPMHGYKFNFSTGSFQNICLPPSFKEGKPDSAVNLGGRIYRMDLAESIFGCYDPKNNSWKALKPFPYDKSFLPRVKATAAFNDTILFYMPGYGFQVYDVRGNEWYLVDVDDPRCFTIVGEAVVLENTIYAVTSLGVLLALSIVKEVSGGDAVFKCSLRSQIYMPSFVQSIMPSIVPRNENRPILFPRVRTEHLVHLGGVDFCLVRSCYPLLSEEPKLIHVTFIHVTYMSLTGGNVIVKSDHLFKCENQSEVVLCFSLPEWNTTALEEGKQFVFKLDPFTAGDKDHSCVKDSMLETYPEISRGAIKILKYKMASKEGCPAKMSEKTLSSPTQEKRYDRANKALLITKRGYAFVKGTKALFSTKIRMFTSDHCFHLPWVAIHGPESICLVIGYWSNCTAERTMCSFGDTIISEVECLHHFDAYYNDDDLHERFGRNVKTPFAVVSVPKACVHEGSSFEYDMPKASKFVEDLEGLASSVDETILRAISGFQHLCPKELNAEDIWVTVLILPDGETTHLHLEKRREYLAVMKGGGSSSGLGVSSLVAPPILSPVLSECPPPWVYTTNLPPPPMKDFGPCSLFC